MSERKPHFDPDKGFVGDGSGSHLTVQGPVFYGPVDENFRAARDRARAAFIAELNASGLWEKIDTILYYARKGTEP